VEAVSPAGPIGAFLGLIVGWLDYKVVGGWVERKLRETDRSQTAADKARLRAPDRLVPQVVPALDRGGVPGRGLSFGQRDRGMMEIELALTGHANGVYER
jgi:hypothetical protein